ncbi:MAG: hypothetical protein RL648_1274 [Verrucomicrobiota bacterium]
MNMARLIHISLSACAAGFTCALAESVQTNEGSALDRPNIVWLVTEDNSVHYLRLYADGGAPMPTVERLALSGLVFDRAYANAPVCSTARSALISGCYGPRTFTNFHRAAVKVPMPDGLRMFPWYLREAGYYATNNAKEDYNFIKGEGVWDESSARASYANRAPGQPFFHVQNFGVTHEGRLHFPERDVDGVETVTPAASVPIFPIHPDTPLFRYTNARYRDFHRLADEQMGAFIAQLEAEGLMEETIVFYFGDHGGVLPGSKGYLNETGLRVPLVIHVPEKWRHLIPFTVGTRVDFPVQFVDFGPTVLRLAGLEVPEGMDGKPFSGWESGSHGEALSSGPLFAYADRFDEKYDMVRSVMKGRFRYVRQYQPFNVDALHNNYRYRMAAYEEWRQLWQAGELSPQQSGFFFRKAPEALYDIEADPFELRNLAGQVEYADILREMRQELRAWLTAMPDLSFFPEPILLAESGNPEAFGNVQRARIVELMDIADLALSEFGEVRSGIESALESDDPMKRYWGWIVCSAFGSQAIEFIGLAEIAAQADSEWLVRLRAAEFLGLSKQADPRPYLTDVLKEAPSEVSAGLILNTIALFHDLGLPVRLQQEDYPAPWFDDEKSNVLRRFQYLNGSSAD